MMKLNDSELIKKCLEGDLKAFDVLIDRYQKPVFNIALRIARNDDDAQDIAQTVFIKAFENLKTFNFEFKFFSWIYRMTVNESINFQKSQKRFGELQANSVSKDQTPEDEFIKRKLNEHVLDAIDELPVNYRTVIIFRHFEDLPYKDIGFILDIPEKTVKSRLFTARKLLCEIFQKRGILAYD